MKNLSKDSLLKFIGVLISIILLLYILTDLGIWETFSGLISSLTPFFLAFFIAWIMRPLGNILAEKTKLNHGQAYAISIVVNLLIVFSFFFIVIPVLIAQIFSILSDLPDIYSNALNNITNYLENNSELIYNAYSQIIEYAQKYVGSDNLNQIDFAEIVSSFGSNVTDWFTSIVSSVYSFISFIVQVVIAYIMAFYFIGDLGVFVEKLTKLVFGKKYDKYNPILVDASKTLFGYLKGIVLDSTAVGLVVSIGCLLIGIPNPFIFGMIAGVTNIIPYLGPVIGGIPIMLIALTISPLTFLLSLVVVFGTQFIEANFFQPRIMAKATNLHPVSVMVGLLIFGSLFGLVGMVIATPSMAVINVLLKHSKYDINL